MTLAETETEQAYFPNEIKGTKLAFFPTRRNNAAMPITPERLKPA